MQSFGKCDDAADKWRDGSWWHWADETLIDPVHQFFFEHWDERLGDVAVFADFDRDGSFSQC